MVGIDQAAEGVPAGGVGNHAAGADLFAIGQLHTHRLALLKQHLGNAGAAAEFTAVALEASHQFFGDHPHPPLGVIDAPGMAIGKHHARIDHGRAIGGHHRPAVALDVDEFKQDWILDVLAGHAAHVHRQPAG